MLEKAKKLNLLYIEDNVNTKINYLKTFEILFNKVYTSSSYSEAIYTYQNNKCDFVIVDIELNDEKNGFDIANKIKKLNKKIPIVFLTGHNESEFILEAINSSMNGYIVKPLDIKKLLDIMSNIIDSTNDSNIINFQNFKYNLKTYELFDIDNKKVSLGKKENLLLQTLLKNKNRTMPREELEYNIWEEPQLSESALKNMIASLRKKIGKKIIVNESKIGWRINID